MSLYYEDADVQLYHGRCEDILPTLSLTGSVHLLTDPPYFKVKDNDWDNQWSKAAEFLDWMGEWLDLAKPLLSADASVWVFASPELTSAVESVVAQRFRVLNSIRWVKPQGWHMKAELEAARSFLSPWEGIVFAEQPVDHTRLEVTRHYKAVHRRVFAPVGAYLQGEWERAGWKPVRLASVMGYDSAMPTRWAEGSSLPTAAAYQRLREAVGVNYFTREHAELRDEWNELSAIYERECALIEGAREKLEEGRRPFTVAARERATDVWTFDTVAPYPGKHVCEKPEGLLSHMIETTTRPGDTILDPYVGSGAVLDVARKLGRKAVGIEMDRHWCSQSARRLSQQAFDFSALEVSE